MLKEKKILADTWYAEYLDGNIITVNQYFKQSFHQIAVKLSERSKFVRGCLLFFASRKFDLTITTLGGSGVTFFIILQAIFSRKRNRIVLLEFFRPTPTSKLYRVFWPLWTKFIYGPSLHLTLAKAQVLTESEIERYSVLFGVPKERFTFISWPLHYNIQRKFIGSQPHNHDPNVAEISNYVMTSGRVNVDWETIFEAAESSTWSFLAVCNSQNLERVKKLNKNKRAKILSDISQEEHGTYVKGATVYALCVAETNTSVGHIRLMNTIEQGVPVVASNVSGLEGYAVDGVNAILVPPGNPNALKKAIDSLMSDPELRRELVKTARDFQQHRTFDNYIAEIKGCINDVVSTDR